VGVGSVSIGSPLSQLVVRASASVELFSCNYACLSNAFAVHAVSGLLLLFPWNRRADLLERKGHKNIRGAPQPNAAERCARTLTPMGKKCRLNVDCGAASYEYAHANGGGRRILAQED
jgi:hypothetical protein